MSIFEISQEKLLGSSDLSIYRVFLIISVLVLVFALLPGFSHITYGNGNGGGECTADDCPDGKDNCTCKDDLANSNQTTECNAGITESGCATWIYSYRIEFDDDNNSDPIQNDPYNAPGGATFELEDTGNSGLKNGFKWTSSGAQVCLVVVKAGKEWNIYSYSGDDSTDDGLVPPWNENSGKRYDISHITFCYDSAVDPQPEVQIEKSTNGEDADYPPGPIINADSSVTWNYKVTNVGNVDLTDITVTDDMGTSDENDDYTCTITSLVVDAYKTCSTSGTAAQPGQYSNTAEASVNYDGDTYDDTDPSHYFVRDISLDVTGDLTLEIVQKNADTGQIALRDLNAGNTTKKFPGTITATVYYESTDFQVGATYYTATQEDGSREDAKGLLVLKDQDPSNPDPDQYPLQYSSSYVGSGSTPSTSTMENLSDDFQSCGGGCYSAAYSLYVNLAKLGLDYENEDAITFYNNFWLYNSGT